MSNNKYHIDFSRLAKLLLPISLRSDSVVALLQCLIEPIRLLYEDFQLFKTEKEYHLSHNDQVFSLEKVINDFCDSTACYISDGEFVEEVFLPYNADGELANFQISMPYNGSPDVEMIFNSTGISGLNSCFVVHLPRELQAQIDEAELRRLIDMYRIAGKTYIILYDIVLSGYTVQWTNEACVQAAQQATDYSVQWTDESCVQAYSEVRYSAQWSDDACVQKNDTDVIYAVQWANELCVQEHPEDTVYSTQWSDLTCVQVEQQQPVYLIQWIDEVCAQYQQYDEQQI